MRYLIPVIFFLLSLSTVSAFIDLAEPLPASYFQASSIAAQFNVSTQEKWNGLFKLGLVCSSFQIDYYLTPLSLEKDAATVIFTPPFTLPENAQGSCRLRAQLQNTDASLRQEYLSPEFDITRTIPAVVTTSTERASPGEQISASVTVPEFYVPDQTKVRLRLGTQSWNYDVSEFPLDVQLSIPSSAPPGKYPFTVKVTDAKDNLGENYTTFYVNQVATRIDIAAASYSVQAGELELTAAIVDQVGNPMDGSLELAIEDEDGRSVVEQPAQSNQPFTVLFGPEDTPGRYTLNAISGELGAERIITVLETTAVDVTLENGIVNLTNTGNVEYDGQFVVDAANEQYSAAFEEETGIEPGKSVNINLNKELPQGTYDVTVRAIDEQSFSAVQVDDQRSIIKKLSASVGITGNVTAVDGSGSKLIAGIVILFIVALSVYLLRGFLFKRPAQPAKQPAQEPPKEESEPDVREREDVKRFVKQALDEDK